MPKINSFIFLDFETGGLEPKKHAVTEVAAIAIKGDTLEKIDLMSTYIQPYGEYTYDEGALKATGITMEDIESGVPVKQAVEEMIELFKKADLYSGKGALRPVLFAHNSKFDKGFLLQLFDHTKKLKELEKRVYGGVDYYGNFQPEMIDTITFSKMVFGNDEEMTNYKLDSCITRAGVDLPDAHKAINDTLALKDMMVHFISGLRSGSMENGEKEESNRFRKHFQF